MRTRKPLRSPEKLAQPENPTFRTLANFEAMKRVEIDKKAGKIKSDKQERFYFAKLADQIYDEMANERPDKPMAG